MAKEELYIKLRDKTSSYWIQDQNITLRCNIPAKVKNTILVKKLLMNRVVVEVGESEWKEYENKLSTATKKIEIKSSSENAGDGQKLKTAQAKKTKDPHEIK